LASDAHSVKFDGWLSPGLDVQMADASPQRAQLVRKAALVGRAPVAFRIDGKPAVALSGDRILTAVLLARDSLRQSEMTPERRGGFCLIGACQDCWVQLSDGRRVQACTTPLEPGMDIGTGESDAV
jgi:D-hydroxyproline dehydrogenase subunit gamma